MPETTTSSHPVPWSKTEDRSPHPDARWARARYERNSDYLRQYHRTIRARNKTLLMAFVDAARASGCVDCGNKNLSVLHSDHVRGEKFRDIARLVERNCSIQTLLTELDKCETRCANCHLLVTRQRRLAKSKSATPRGPQILPTEGSSDKP